MADERSFTRLCTLFLDAATRCRLYGRDHRLSREAMAALHSHLTAELDEGPLRITLAGDEIHFGDARHDATSGPAYGLARRFGDKGVGLLKVIPGVDRDELDELCVELADAAGDGVRSRPHLEIGTVSLAREPRRGLATEALRVQDLRGARNDPVTAEAAQLAALGRHLRESYEVRVRDFKDIVLSLLSHFSQQGDLFLNLAEVRDHNLFTYLHTCNVATLSMGFAMALGARGRDAFDIGTAALLHDVGKSQVPQEILDKPGPLTAAEWQRIEEHPVAGARMLLQQREVNHLAVTVAFEHHMHFDGVGGYPRAPFSPSTHSQLVAIADTFDALFGKRSYHRRYDVIDALEVLHANAGSVYNPELVDHFCRFVHHHMERTEWQGEEPSVVAD